MRAHLLDIVKHLKEFKISFSGLALGKHDFSFEIDKNFFDCFDYSIVKDGKLTAQVELEKKSNMMIADFHIMGDLSLNCDVCLENFDMPIEIEEQLIVKFQSQEEEDLEVDEILVLSRQEYEFSIADFLYEQITLAVPHYIKCEELNENRSCNSEMKAVLEKLSPQVPEENEEQQLDPRWEALKNINRNN